MDLWLYLHFPALQLDSLLQEQEARPLAVIDSQSNALVQINAQAAEQGVEIGMGLATAATLCRDLQLVPYKEALETGKLQEIARWLYELSADIALYPPSGLLLKVSPMLKLYRGLMPYWQSIQTLLEALPYRYHYATGYTPVAARLLARAGGRHISDDAQKLKQQYSACTIGQTDLSAVQIEKLNRLGITHVADLLNIPLKELSRRFTLDVVQYVGRLSGELGMSLEFHHPPEDFQHYLELLYEIENTSVLHHPLKRQLVLLEDFLRRRDQLCTRIQLRFHQRNGQPLEVTVGSAQGEYQAEKWLELAQLTLEKCQLAAPVYALTLRVNKFQHKEAQSTDLFAGRQGKCTDYQLVSLLQARLGQDRVTGLTRQDDFRPERASSHCPALTPSKNPNNTAPLLRPNLLLPEPQVLTEPVAIIHGPERITTGWWDHSAQVRDYYIAHNKAGQWYWLFRKPAVKGETPQWFLHGYFS
ncbi:DNA polymerase Y family protein [Marinimicrobium sp. ABcell2]|uniref:Y-family DNA polymerase n=1 Tax=Marinimicrobium sp. ABcell2 TaxID=3069751 RepID=UPI0027B29B95|nr:DNA polymerase Y family protein [Marinimicrobium sp. ABcell2]MDQ2077764.1 DNA polymerase Y family protein [Marinimicrobium sp. ABcell2]